MGYSRRFRVIEVTFEVLIEGDNEDAFMTSHIAPVIEISRACKSSLFSHGEVLPDVTLR